MATNKNGGGRSKDRLLLQQEGINPYRHTFYNGRGMQNQDSSSEEGQKVIATVFVGVVVILLLLWFLYQHLCVAGTEEPQGAAAAGRRGGRHPPPRTTGGARGRDSRAVFVRQLPPSPPMETAAAVEVVVRPADDEPPLVCTYRKADGWREESCGVCLSELADGEAVRVLPACLHFFHAACVHEWLRAHATCPLCRAPLVAAAAGG